jgi:DNA-directed RNA polymerase specialized sigma24 family protein
MPGRHSHVTPLEPERQLARPRPPVDDATFEDLYRELAPSLTRLARLVTGSSAVAPDLVHDAFLRVRDRLDTLDDPPAYLRRVVVNLARDWLRRVERERLHQTSLQVASCLPPDLDEVWVALAQLPERRRTALVLRYYEDLRIEDVADVLGCRVGTAKSLVHRGLASLRKVVNP